MKNFLWKKTQNKTKTQRMVHAAQVTIKMSGIYEQEQDRLEILCNQVLFGSEEPFETQGSSDEYRPSSASCDQTSSNDEVVQRKRIKR